MTVGDETNVNAAWVYPHAKEAASTIPSYVAFWKGFMASHDDPGKLSI